MMRRITRRSVLRGAAGISVTLPFLESLLPRGARAQAAPPPLRFGVFFSPNGVIEADWVPSGGQKDFVLSPTLSPLADHRDDIVVLYGLNNETSYMQSGNDHDLSMAHMLTAMRMQGSVFGRAGHVLDGTAGGPSIDQAIAKEIGGETKLRSLELGVESTISDLEPMVTRMSYGGPGDPRTPLDDPKQVFARLFGDSDVSETEIETLHKQRKSVLDGVLAEFNDINGKLGYDDRQKLERHAAAIRDLERQLDLDFEPTGGCQVPEEPPDVSVEVVDCERDGRPTKCVAGFTEIGKAQMDLMVLALACDLTRVVSLQWSTAESTTVHSHLGVENEHHLMSHAVVANRASLTAVETWYSEQFAYLLSELKKVPEGEGTLLDHVLMFWPNELSQAEIHDRRRLPYVLAGGAGGQLETGRFLRYDMTPTPHNHLLASFLNVFGVPASGFGEPDYPGTLVGLV